MPVEFSKAHPHDSSFGASLAMLHELAWGGEAKDVFFRNTVTSNGSRHATSSDHIALHWGNDSASLLPGFDASAILVRDVYPRLLRELLSYYWFMKEPGSVMPDIDDGGRDAIVWNPFLDMGSHQQRLVGAVVKSNPDAGKRAFLIYVLVLRLLAKKPVVFLSGPSSIHLLYEGGVYEATTNRIDSFMEQLPLGAWILVDSGFGDRHCLSQADSLRSYHNAFILHADFPGSDRTQWTGRTNGFTPTFWLEPWCTEELITGRDYQIWKGAPKPSYVDIISFSRRFGTSPRHVYTFASRPETYEAVFRDEIGALTMDRVQKLLGGFLYGIKDHRHFYLILTAVPGPESTENSDLIVGPSSDYVASLLVQQFHGEKSESDVVVKLYEFFLLRLRASNGYLLKRVFLEQFVQGGEWVIVRMEKRGREEQEGCNNWTYGFLPEKLYIRLGHRGRTATIENVPLGEHEKFDGLPWYHYSMDYNLKLKHGLYIPGTHLQAKSEDSLDAFIYDRKENKAMIFHWYRPTFALQQMKILTFEWLRRLGVEHIDLIVLTALCSSFRLSLDIKVPEEYLTEEERVYHIVASPSEQQLMRESL